MPNVGSGPRAAQAQRANNASRAHNYPLNLPIDECFRQRKPAQKTAKSPPAIAFHTAEMESGPAALPAKEWRPRPLLSIGLSRTDDRLDSSSRLGSQARREGGETTEFR